jgi:Ca2+-binding RTX toxin-like protein
MGGNDTLKVSAVAGKAIIDGGDGFDTAEIDLATATKGLSIQLTALPLPGADMGGRPVTPVELISIEALVITTGSGNDLVTGGAGSDRITTGAGNDRVNSGLGADTVSLGDGNDFLTDLGGDGDVIDAGAGNDHVTIGAQIALVAGGLGIDRITADLSRASALNLTLALGGTVSLPGRGYRFTGFEEFFLTFGSGNDTIRVDYGLHQLDGGAGTDSLTVVADETVTFTTTTGSRGTTYTFANGMIATGFETVTIDYRPRTLIGTDGDDTLIGGPGDDLLSGG